MTAHPQEPRATASRRRLAIDVRARHVELDQDLTDHARRRARRRLRRFASHVDRAIIRVSLDNGPLGAPRATCKVVVDLPAGGPVVVEGHASDVRAALDAGIDAAERAVRRLIDRRFKTHGPSRR